MEARYANADFRRWGSRRPTLATRSNAQAIRLSPIRARPIRDGEPFQDDFTENRGPSARQREYAAQHEAFGPEVDRETATLSAAFIRSRVNGISRSRTPVASKMALLIAGAMTVVAASPAPAIGS
jgi:hypothetical protein